VRDTKPGGRSRVAVTVVLDVPHSSPLHYYERINNWDDNKYWSLQELKRAFDADNAEVTFVEAFRAKYLYDTTPAGTTPVTEEPSTTADTEDHPSASAGDPDPSDSTDEAASSAATWDFVVA